MTMIKKRSGEMQEFSRAKMEESMKRAGAKEEVVKKLAESIQVQEGMATQDLRQRIGEELRKVDSSIADAYVSTRRLKAKANPETPADQGRVSEYLAKLFEQQKALPASLYLGARKKDVRVEPAHKTYGEIWLNKTVLDQLAAQDGMRIAVRFRRNAAQAAAAEVRPTQPATVPPAPAPAPQSGAQAAPGLQSH